MKTIIDRKKSAMTVVAASREWAPPTAAGLADFLRPELKEDETLPDLELVQELFGRALARRWERLEAADQAHVAAAARHRASLAERDAATRTLYRGVVDLRTLMRGIFGAVSSRRLLGIKGRTSRDALVLGRQASHLLARLRDRRLPKAAFEPSGSDRARWAAPVEALTRSLEISRAQASLAAKQLEAATAERRRALEDYDAAFAKVAGWLAGTYRAAGRDGRAEAVRPSGRRPGLLLRDGRRTAPRQAGPRQAGPATPEPASVPRQVAAERQERPIEPSHQELTAAAIRRTVVDSKRSA